MWRVRREDLKLKRRCHSARRHYPQLSPTGPPIRVAQACGL